MLVRSGVSHFRSHKMVTGVVRHVDWITTCGELSAISCVSGNNACLPAKGRASGEAHAAHQAASLEPLDGRMKAQMSQRRRSLFRVPRSPRRLFEMMMSNR